MKPSSLLQRIDLENQRGQYLWPGLAVVLLLGATTVLLLLLPRISKANGLQPYFLIALVGLGSSVLVFVVAWLCFRRSKKATAQRLDRSHESRNRLEAALELSATNHALKGMQLEEATRFFFRIEPSNWPVWRAVLLGAIVLLLIGQGALILRQHREVTGAAAAKRGGEQTQPSLPSDLLHEAQLDQQSREALARLREITKAQQALAKATSDARKTRTEENLKNEGSRLAQEQTALAQETRQLPPQMPSNHMSSALTDRLRHAEVTMNTASEQLRSEALPQAEVSQQKALADLKAATELFQQNLKQEMAKAQALREPAEDPFDEKPLVKMDLSPAMNPESQLAALAKKQSEILEKVKPHAQAPNAPAQPRNAPALEPAQFAELDKKQGEITRNLSELATNEKLNQEVRRSIARAEKASHEAKEWLCTENPNPANVAALQTQTHIRVAAEKLQRLSRAEAEKAMRKAQDALSEAKLKVAANPRDAAAKVQEARQTIGRESRQQHETGEQAIAENLAVLAEQIHKQKPSRELKALVTQAEFAKNEPDQQPRPSEPVADQEAAKAATEKIETLRQTVAAARSALQARSEQLASALDRLQQLQARLQDLSDRSKARNADEKEIEDLAREMERAAKDIDPDASLLRIPSYRAGAGLDYLVDGVQKLTVVAKQQLEKLERMELVRAFDPEEVPEMYRQEVPVYFENLSKVKSHP